MADQFANDPDSDRRDTVVSFDAEELILVDAHDRAVGHASKAACHDGDGMLHRAFSLFVFNDKGELLLQRRALGKRLWPGFWSNSCCSHPRRGESMTQATHRRLRQELGLRCALHFLFKFEYRADYEGLGAEHELCSVFVGTSADPVHANVNEVEAWRFVSSAALDREMATHPQRFTPWLKLEWQRMRRDFRELVPPVASERPRATWWRRLGANEGTTR